MSRLMSICARAALAAAVASFLFGAAPASAQFGKLKEKVKQKVEKSLDEGVDKLDQAAQESETGQEAPAEAPGAPGAPGAPATGKGGTAQAEDMALYTKYDFVPGDKVLFWDDLAAEEMGEFPSRWGLDHGVFEIVKQHGQPWIMCTDRGIIRPRLGGPLPARYTIEMDFYTTAGETRGHWFHIYWYGEDQESQIAELSIKDSQTTAFRLGDKTLADKQLPDPLAPGRHTLRVMATGKTMKCYVDHERIANVPSVEGFAPASFALYIDPWLDDVAPNPCLVGAVRFAEGGKTLRQQLDESGRIVTHGILFDSNSDRIKAESYKTLADIGALLAEDQALKVSIEGHTDADGADEANLGLSQRRSDSVRAYLVQNFGVDAARLQCKGCGETKPIDSNDTPEGKANNRRVELVKL